MLQNAEQLQRREEASIRILLVEDDDDIAGRLGAGLADAGFSVERADNGADGYLMGNDEHYDAVILDAGADDYITKPFHIPEVAARLKALIRRSSGLSSPVLSHRGVEFDSGKGVVTRAGEVVEMTARELRMLNFFMHRIGRVVSQAELAEHLYTLDEARESNTIEVYVSRLRRKLGADLIKTVRGLGYRMD